MIHVFHEVQETDNISYHLLASSISDLIYTFKSQILVHNYVYELYLSLQVNYVEEFNSPSFHELQFSPFILISKTHL